MIVGRAAARFMLPLLRWDIPPKNPKNTSMRLWTREVTAKHNSCALWQILLPNVFGFDENFGTVDDTLAMERLPPAYGDRQNRGRKNSALFDGNRF